MSQAKRMSKRARTLILTCVAVLVLGCMLAVLLLLPEPETEVSSDPVSSTTATTLVDKTIDANNKEVEQPIKSVTVKRTNEEFTIAANADGELQVLKYADLPIHNSTISGLTALLASLNATQKVTTVSDLKDFGLDAPQAVLTVTYHDDTTNTFSVGTKTPLDDGYYLQMAGDDSVYIVEKAAGEVLIQASTVYIGTSLITAPSVNSDDEDGKAILRDMALSGTVRADKPFAYQATTTDDEETMPYRSYKITSPYLVGANPDKETVYAIFTSLTAVEAYKAYPTAADLKACGLDVPYSVAKLHLAVTTLVDDPDAEPSATTADGKKPQKTSYYNVSEHTITVGDQDADGNYYALVDDYDAIYLLSESSISSWVKLQYEDVVEINLFEENIAGIQSVAITANGKETVFDLTHHPDAEDTDDMLTVQVNGKTYPTADFRTLYVSMMGINRYQETDEKPTGTPDVKIALTRNGEDAPFTELKFYAYSPSLYTCLKPTGEYYRVKASEIEMLIQQMGNYLEGKPVSSN